MNVGVLLWDEERLEGMVIMVMTIALIRAIWNGLEIGLDNELKVLV